MTDETSNDNMRAYADARSSGPDAHGQAAMLLVESLIHGLIARSVITVADAVELVDTAAEVTEVLAADAVSPTHSMEKSQEMLRAISRSLAHDLRK